MRKLWSFLWWMVAAVVAVTVLLNLIAPYIWLIMVIFAVIVLSFIGWEIYKRLSGRVRRY